ncbi:MAG: tetratricopeptide repeat protein [Chitinispirillaceae bacterium]|nr:tetratricopeptide repeat protein [Chitinispirillaceae bacterium]
MTTAIQLTAAVFMVSLIVGCAATHKTRGSADALLPEIDVVQVKEKSDEALKLAQEAKLDIEVLMTRMTELDSRVIAVSEEVASISSAKIEELETRLALLTEAYKDLFNQVKSVDASSAVKAKKGDQTATFSPSSATGLLSSPEYDLYQKGLHYFNARKFDLAITSFTDQLNEFPAGKYSADAHFWIAESNYSLNNHSTAVVSYHKVTEIKGSSKADDALYKLGLTYLKLGQQGLAKDALKMLVQRYPASEYVERAEKQLKTLK